MYHLTINSQHTFKKKNIEWHSDFFLSSAESVEFLTPSSFVLGDF